MARKVRAGWTPWVVPRLSALAVWTDLSVGRPPSVPPEVEGSSRPPHWHFLDQTARGDGLEVGFDRRAARFEERRQRQLLAQVLGVLVGGEAGAVGRDLEQHPSVLAEVDRVEVVPIDDRSD